MSSVFAPSLAAVALVALVWALTYGGGAYVVYRVGKFVWRMWRRA